MRPAIRLLAQVKPRFLEPGTPTGLTGLLTHASPRTTLLFLYSRTLETLKSFPEHSVYRQSTEALTKYRMNIVEKTEPEGLETWQERIKPTFEEFSHAFERIPNSQDSNKYNIIWAPAVVTSPTGIVPGAFKSRSKDKQNNENMRKWSYSEGSSNEEESVANDVKLELHREELEKVVPTIEPEPALSVEQIQAIENEISAGLLEEIIQVAEGELKLVHEMAKCEAWQDLEEKPQEGQWTYNERGTHTTQTQKA